VTAIIHFADSIIVPDPVLDPLGFYLNNTANNRTLRAVAIASGLRHFVFSSTAAVYGIRTGSLITEDAPLRPMSPYGMSKMMTEATLHDVGVAHGLATDPALFQRPR
jgi:UDP-glucose 4-epimerase